ncbi:MAG: hypothetical protein ACI9NT_000275 [Bacteroidia bacterium]|jgi:hypothetical protein
MFRLLLIALAVGNVLTGLVVLVAPQWFYDTVPGVSMMGPFNIHFIRDAGLSYAASGLIAALGWHRQDYLLCVAGFTWPCFHALFHLQMWLARGLPVDLVAFVNLTGIQFPAWAALIAAVLLLRQRRGVAHAQVSD